MKKALRKNFCTVILSLATFLFFSQASAYDLIVAKDGSGNYTTVQAAINAVPANLSAPYTIFIKNGRYKEKITIPSNKPFIQLTGESVANTILTYDDYASKLVSCGTTVGTQNSASFTVNATDFAATNITFENNFGDGSQAVAVLVNNDRAVFKNCRFLANQDTLYIKGSGTPKVYFKNCYIDGNVDFIFGSSVALFDSCVIYAKSRTSAGSSFITAPNTPVGQTYGYVFRDARLPNNTGGTSYFLSRPWPSPSEAGTRQKTLFLSSRLSSHIQPAGWTTWDANTITANLYYGEYNSRHFNGALVDVSQRVPWSYQLSQADSATYTMVNMFGSWDPCSVQTGICDPIATEIAVSNFRVAKGASNSAFNWNISWPLSGITYELFRSTNNVSYTSVYTTTAINDTAVNFSYTDPTIPASGTFYKYYLVASKAGYANHVTDTLQVSSTANLVVNASPSLYMCGFSQAFGTPSAAQTYTISGSDLTGNVLITPPVNYEVSTNQTNWFTNASPLSLTPTSGSLATTTIFIRLNAPGVGTYSGDVLNASAAVTTINVPVSGSVVAAPTSFPLQYWPLTQNNNDSAAARSVAVTASSSSLNRLVVSDGTMPATPIPAYTGQWGQSLGATAQGNWSAVGGTLKRDYYEQFTITAASGYTVRVDSLRFQASWYLTNSATKMSMVYSKNGFSAPADSTEFSNGIGSGGSLVLSASGNFLRSFPVLRNDAGPSPVTDAYALALNNNSGVTLNAGETLTIRLYFACSSTGTPRFAFLKNVVAKGLATENALPVTLLSFNASGTEHANLSWRTSQEININYYEVQRSLDGIAFTSAGTVQSISSSSTNTYSFLDNFRLQGNTYYRLKITDRDGRFSYSKIVLLNPKTNNIIWINPNPVEALLNVTIPVSFAASSLLVIANDGKLLIEEKLNAGDRNVSVDVSKMPPGIYQLVLISGISKASERFLKK